jgi:hypothetical protein
VRGHMALAAPGETQGWVGASVATPLLQATPRIRSGNRVTISDDEARSGVTRPRSTELRGAISTTISPSSTTRASPVATCTGRRGPPVTRAGRD